MKKWIAVVLLICLVYSAFYCGLTIKQYTVTTANPDYTGQVRIVFLADLHSHIHGKKQQGLIQKIKKQEPDIILLGGDIADNGVPIEGTKLLLEGIRDIAPIYYVTGNHEFWSHDIEGIRDVFRSYGVTILSSEYETIHISDNEIIIAGIDDPDKQYYEDETYNEEFLMNQAFASLENTNAFKILLAHRPERIEQYRRYDFDLVLSGHAHGGQMRIPFFVNGVYAPNQGYLPEYAGGRYDFPQDDMTFIVSRGLANTVKFFRIFNPLEIVVIDVVKES